MNKAFLSAVFFLAVTCGAALPEETTNVFEEAAVPAPQSQLDKLVFAQLQRLNIQPRLCSDAVFVRRAFLDVLGTLPTVREAKAFIEDPDPKTKRQRLIDDLLQRDEFADYWAMKWSDILRIKAEFPINLWPNAAQAYYHWVRASLAENKPYDQFVREMLTSSGSNFRVGPVNFYRAVQNRTPEGIARAVALTFMGSRAELWPTNRLAGMCAFFSQIGYKPTGEWKEEHVFWDPLSLSKLAGNIAPGRAAIAQIGPLSNSVAQTEASLPVDSPHLDAIFPDGQRIKLSTDRDPRGVFADWLITPKNPWFTRSIVNRVWAWLLGRGIIQEPDDIRDDNPPSNPALLKYLEQEMIRGHYDLKRFYRLILTSQTYQLSSMPRFTTPEAEANFASYRIRRLDAEVLIDAINKVTGSSDLYTSPIPEPFTYIPRGMPAVAIADGSITSPFLALFGRSARATGMENERNDKPTPAQALYLLNSTEVQRKLEQGTNLQAIIGFGRRSHGQILNELYLTILSRFPTPEERKIVEAYGTEQPARRGSRKMNAGKKANKADRSARSDEATNTAVRRRGPIGSLGQPARQAGKWKSRQDWVDVAWSLINSEEFLYRH